MRDGEIDEDSWIVPAAWLRRVDDPTELLMKVNLGGGTDIARALRYAPGLAFGVGHVESDEFAAAVEGAIALSAEIVHRGSAHLPPGFAERLIAAESRLRAVGLQRAADAVAALTRPDLDNWADAHIRLLVTAEQL